MKRQRAVLRNEDKGSYFTSTKDNLSFVSSGCTLLDCALSGLGGGWALGRIVNIVGDRSTAKTALATEALINFTIKYPNGTAAYCESESAFDKEYARAMGLPIDKIDFRADRTEITTVEAFINDFEDFLDDRTKDSEPGIYVLDSLDALSDEAEMDRKVGEASYGTAKAKLLSEFFRKTAHRIERTKVLLMIVSQVRDNIGAMMGEKHKRSGGRSLDFYASQVVWLARIKTLKRTIKKVERPYGVTIKAQVKKNKVSLPFREVEFDFIFGYGVEDLSASVAWLTEIGRLDQTGLGKDYAKGIGKLSDAEYQTDLREITQTVRKFWVEVETDFLPKRTKYG